MFDYDYVLDFAFDAASQDAIFYTQEFNVEDANLQTQTTGNQELAYLLAQYQSIDESLFADISLVAAFEDTQPPPEVRAIVKNAFQIFAGIAKEVGQAWGLWQPNDTHLSTERCFRLRRHSHSDGRTALSVTKDGIDAIQTPLPLARLKGRPYRHFQFSGLSHSLQEAINSKGEPIPRTRRGEHYQVVDPDLSLLFEQNCWGKISITRNAELVNRRSTNNAFVLHIDNVRALQPLTPAFTITQRLDVANELGKLNTRLKLLIEALLFKNTRGPLSEQQMLSLGVSFARPLSENELVQTSEPADFTALFAPVVSTPGLVVQNTAEEGKIDPGALADEIASYLSLYLKERALAPNEAWAIKLKLFSSLKGQVSPALLLEVLDMRTRMSDR